MENWALEKEWLDTWAVHYQTGEKIPQEYITKIHEAANFQSGYQNDRQLSFGLVDTNITPEQRNEIIIKMAEQGVACNVHYKPLPMHTAYRKLGFDIADYPHAYAHFANEITLPLHTRLTDEDVAYVIEKYVEILKEYI